MYDDYFTYLQSIVLINSDIEDGNYGSSIVEEFQLCRQGSNPFYIMSRMMGATYLTYEPAKYPTANKAFTALIKSYKERNNIKDHKIRVLTEIGKVFISPDEQKVILDEISLNYEVITH